MITIPLIFVINIAYCLLHSDTNLKSTDGCLHKQNSCTKFELSHHILDLCLLIGGDVPLPVKQQLLLEISKFGHLRKHTHFLSIVGVAKEQDMTLLAVERLLEFTTLSHYLRLDSNIKIFRLKIKSSVSIYLQGSCCGEYGIFFGLSVSSAVMD